MGPAFSESWTPRAIRKACGPAHTRYKRELEQRYSEFFISNPKLAGSHRWKARDRPAALPPSRPGLETLVPKKGWHRHHLSAGSSQMLAVALLGSAIERDPSLVWLAEVLELETSFRASVPKVTFEVALEPQTLNEHPYVSSIDMLVDDENVVLCIEAKLWEPGIGTCRCAEEDDEQDDSARSPKTPVQERAACSRRILERPEYWRAARDVLQLPERVEGRPCPIAACYQVVRNFAAARALARGRRAVFALLYDQRNPYFEESGAWAGWPSAINSMVNAESPVAFRACSWQTVLLSGAVPRDVVDWARVKHGL
jgi:hypothetical protein